MSRFGGGQSLWGVVAIYAWTNLEWVRKDRMLWYQVDVVSSRSVSLHAELCCRIGAFIDQLVLVTISLTWVCFSMWVLVCFKFLGLFFVGLMIFLSFFWRFRWRMVFGWKMGTSSAVVVDQEENPLPMSGYLGLFETCMSGYLGLFETCVTKFVQIWVYGFISSI